MMNSGLAMFGVCGLVSIIFWTGRSVGTAIWVGILFSLISAFVIAFEIRCIKEEEIHVTRRDIPKEEY